MREPIPDVQVDAIRVELALINLVGNAVKYSDPAEEDRWVRVAVQRDEEGYWRISVSDNGMGVTLVPYGTVPKVSIVLGVRTGNIDEAPVLGSQRCTAPPESRKNNRLGTDAQTPIVMPDVE